MTVRRRFEDLIMFYAGDRKYIRHGIPEGKREGGME